MNAAYPPRHRRARKWWLVALCLGFLTIAPPAFASPATDNIVPTATYNAPCQRGSDVETERGPICLTDNAGLGWWMEYPIDVTTGYDTDFEHGLNLAMSDSYNGTDLTVFYDSTPAFSGTAETDIIYRSKPQDFRGANTLGYTYCDDVAGTGVAHKCDQQYINIRNPNDGYYNARWLACHETGHGVGLVHGESASPFLGNQDARLGCMVGGRDTSLRFLGETNVYNINDVHA